MFAYDIQTVDLHFRGTDGSEKRDNVLDEGGLGTMGTPGDLGEVGTDGEGGDEIWDGWVYDTFGKEGP